MNLINCNIVSMTSMTKIVLDGMIERKRGLIINVSSLSSLIPAPLLALYGASKVVMIDIFSEAFFTPMYFILINLIAPMHSFTIVKL